MRVVVNETEPIIKAIKDLPTGVAFKYRECWYIKIHMMDEKIESFGEFFDTHVIKDDWNEKAECYDDYVTCLHLGSQSLCYLRKDASIDEYGTPTLSVALYQ